MVSPINSYGSASSGLQSVGSILSAGSRLAPVFQPAPAAAPLTDDQTAQIQVELMTQLMQLVGLVAQSNFGAQQAIAAKAPVAGVAGVAPPPALAQQPAAAPPSNGRLKIAQIDTFAADNTGYNHGTDMARILRNGGGDPSLAGRVDLMQFDIAGGNSAGKITSSLQNVLQRVQAGEQVDAVNISLTAFQNDGNTQQSRALIDQLSALGVPVVVAAGNNGPGQVNQLLGNGSFNVQSATNGRINPSSGRGNTTFGGRTTSVATANLAPILAAQKAAGLSPAQIRANLGL